MYTHSHTPQSSLLDSIRKTLEQRSLLTARSRHDFVQALSNASKNSTPTKRANYFKDKVITEILTSEETYVQGLKELQSFEQVGLDSSILLNLETIIHVNEKLLEDLKNDKEKIGRSFVNYAPFLKHYSTYAGGFQEANCRLQNLSPEVKMKIKEREEEIGKTVQSLLITPIQRVPRYKLLVEQLIGASGGRNARDLIEALKSLNTVANHMNEFVRKHENDEKLVLLQTMIGSQLEILSPGRTLIHSGDAIKVNSSKPVHLILTSDNFVVTKVRGEYGKPGALDVNLVLPLKTMSIAMTDEFVELLCPPEVFRFTCETNVEWYDLIQDAIWSLKSKRATLKKPFSSVAFPMKLKKPFRSVTIPKKLKQPFHANCFSNIMSSPEAPEGSYRHRIAQQKKAARKIVPFTPSSHFDNVTIRKSSRSSGEENFNPQTDGPSTSTSRPSCWC